MVNPAQIVDIFSHVVAIASVLAALTPNKYDNLCVDVARHILDGLAFNWGNARNVK